MIVVGNERYKFELYKRKPNTPYEWEETPSCVFKGRPASQLEKKQFRLQSGVNATTDSVFIISSNLPENVKEQDRVVFLGKIWSVASVGYYYDEARFVNAGLFSDEYIAKRCPRGVALQ